MNRMKNNLLIIVFTIFLAACTQESLFVANTAESDYRIDFVETCYSQKADSIYQRFNIINTKTGEKELLGDIQLTELKAVTNNKNVTVEGVRMMDLIKGKIPENIVVSLLIDKSVHAEDMYSIKNAVSYIVDNLPPNTVYISFFDERIRDSRKISPENIDMFDNDFTVTKNNKIIFDAALTKFKELCGAGDLISDEEFAKRVGDDNIKKFLVVLTDGRVDANNPNTSINIDLFSDFVMNLDSDKDSNKRVEIHALRYGENDADVGFTLQYLCVDIRNLNVKGGSYFADPVSFIENIKETDSSIPDYELVLLNSKGKVYNGKSFLTSLEVVKKNMTIAGQTQYILGTTTTPVKAGTKNNALQLVFGVLFGLVLIGISFLCMQIVIPFIRFKLENFNNRYVRRYSFDDDTIIKCHYCLNEIRDGEEIVTKCHHTVHKHCWIENGCKCTDYGKNCKKGKQFLFDMNKLFSVNNRPYYTKFALYGMGGGLLLWTLFQLIILFVPAPFSAFTEKLLSIFSNENVLLQSAFYPKSDALLTIGALSGFIFVIIFSFLNKFRQRQKDSLLIILLRSLAGSLCTFISFLLGIIIGMICNACANNIFIDWIPWILAGCLLGIVLLFRTNTEYKQIIPGGIIAGLICFIILLTGGWIGIYAVITALMFFGAGIGVAFISSRHIIHKYYLKYKGRKVEKIAIHKWMSVAGGSNEVTIGRSADAIIQMNWDEHPSILDVHVRLFFDKKNRLPCIKILSNDVTYNGVFAKNNAEFLLKNGVKFTIGNTEFQYIES